MVDKISLNHKRYDVFFISISNWKCSKTRSTESYKFLKDYEVGKITKRIGQSQKTNIIRYGSYLKDGKKNDV